MGWAATTTELLGNAKVHEVAYEAQQWEIETLLTEDRRLEAMTDDEYLAEQKRLRGLN